MPRSAIEDPLKTYKFVVEIDGFARAGFTEATGLESTTEVIEYREGGDNEQPRKSPGTTNFSDITLKRGLTEKSQPGTYDMFDWREDVHGVGANGRQAMAFRRDLDIVMKNRDNSTGARFRVYNAWPSSYKLSDLNASEANAHVIEEMTLAHEGWDRIL